ncbi:hypothetical protein C9374_000158 [Naegleria lovaniensis]|uniref:Succinate dehydrogenase n=1 Tax=Naegleria lovaniensis TaxID=51637 RepID=A0AA88KP44_NAELO|nr:uncharacterized protein C9374_000158 [Naegleria lovaniensis]KAG2388719.1 hypothetical protein C9374_000158 [Naegleria lovaniensis]
MGSTHSTTMSHSSTTFSSRIDSFLRSVQQYTGIAFSFFLSLHVMNTMTAMISQTPMTLFKYTTTQITNPGNSTRTTDSNDDAQDSKKKDTFSSIIQYLKRKIYNEPLQLHRYAGYVLLVLMPVHITATRFTYPIDSEFSQVTFSMEKNPGRAIMLPYYTIMLMSGVYHLFYGLNAAVFSYQFSKKSLFGMFGVVFTLAFIGFLGAGGVLYPDRIDRTNYSVWEKPQLMQ